MSDQPSGQYKCDKCNISFNSQEEYMEHENKEHVGMAQSNHYLKPIFPFFAFICSAELVFCHFRQMKKLCAGGSMTLKVAVESEYLQPRGFMSI